MLSKDRRNFHAWGYRQQVVSRLESAALAGTSLAEAEFAFTDKKIREDLSNYSAWHRRARLLPRLLDERGADDAARRALLDGELGLVAEALNVGPDDQSLWYYHRFLMRNLVSSVGRPTIAPSLAHEDRVTYVVRELDAIRDLLDDYADVRLLYDALVDCTLDLCRLQERRPDGQERDDLVVWLEKLKVLDPMRMGRWVDLEKTIGLQAEVMEETPGGVHIIK